MQIKKLSSLAMCTLAIFVLLVSPIDCSGKPSGSGGIPDEKVAELTSLARPGDIILGASNWIGHVGVINPEGDKVVEANTQKGHVFNRVNLSDFARGYKHVALLRANDPSYGSAIANKADEIAQSHWKDEYTYAYIDKSKWDSDKYWFCSEFAYKACRRAGFDLYPKPTGAKCWNLFAPKSGEYPYLDKMCTWWTITPGDVYFSPKLNRIFEWNNEDKPGTLVVTV